MRTASALAWVLLPTLLAAAPPTPDKEAPLPSRAEALRKALDQPVTLKIDNKPLSVAVDALHDATHVPMVFDAPLIQQLGLAPDQMTMPVQVDLKGVKARTALRTLLAPFGLSYAAIGGGVIITTADGAMMHQMRQRVTVDVGKADLAGVLRQIGRETGVVFIVDSRAEKEAKTEVSLQVEDVPLETAVRLLTEMAGMKPVRVGDSLFVTTKEIANNLRNDPDFAQPPPPLPNPYGQQPQVFFGPSVNPAPVPQPALPPPAPPASNVEKIIDVPAPNGADAPAPEKKEDK